MKTLTLVQSTAPCWKNRNVWFFSTAKNDSQHDLPYFASAEIADSDGEYRGKSLGNHNSLAECRKAIEEAIDELINETASKRETLNLTCDHLKQAKRKLDPYLNAHL